MTKIDMNTRHSIKNIFSYVKPLNLAGFPKIDWYGGLSHRFALNMSAEDLLETFITRIERGIGNTYLPVYRMADGEYEMLLGWRPQNSDHQLNGWNWNMRERLRAIGRDLYHRGEMRTCWEENYSICERLRGRRILRRSIKAIASNGILAVYMAVRPDGWGEQYIQPLGEWFHRNDIHLNESNCLPFYFVYAALNGPSRKRIFRGRRILVVTWLQEDRCNRIKEYLESEGVRDVQFMAISRTRSLYSYADPIPFKGKVDLAIVAGGIGSAAVICQLEQLEVPCIDSGICIEAMIKPELRLTRPFLCDQDTYNRLRGNNSLAI